MQTLPEELRTWVAASRTRLSQAGVDPQLDRVGRVVQAGDGVAQVSGLPDARLEEMLLFDHGICGLVMDLDADLIGCILLGDASRVAAGSLVRGTGRVVHAPVGDALLGRVVDAVGNALDGGAPVEAVQSAPAQRAAPGIIDRGMVERPLATGLLAIDAAIPLGRGQRELIIGDRATGKTAIAVDAIINQRDSGVICIYAAVGQKASAVAGVIDAVRRMGAAGHCVFVVGGADDAAGLQWLTPYSACSIGEYFMAQGRDVLLVIDDLTKHAAAYRQLSLLLRRPPGREAYPGDIFYIHSRLLERCARLSPQLGGGSMTALPIAETQAGNISAYIPTNLISITDGQIFLDSTLFNDNQKPAVDIGRSVSRVGGKAQAAAIKPYAERLRLEYAQFLELEVFTRFGSMVDERARRTIEHGRRIRAVLSQPQFSPLSLAEELALLLALAEGVLDEVPVARIGEFRAGLRSHLSAHQPQLLALDDGARALTAAEGAALEAVLAQLADTLKAPPGAAPP